MPVLDKPIIPDYFSLPNQNLDISWTVILHNDDITPYFRVINALMKVCKLDRIRASNIMMEAHNNGKAQVISDTKEKCIEYQKGLESYGLTITIEPQN